MNCARNQNKGKKKAQKKTEKRKQTKLPKGGLIYIANMNIDNGQ